MSISKVYKNDIGTKIILDAGCNISAATVLKILYSKPGKTRAEGEWEAEAEGTNSAKYFTKEGDLNAVGKWNIQLYIESPTWTGFGEIVVFEVYDNLD